MSKNLFFNNDISELLKENEKFSNEELKIELEDLIKNKNQIGFKFPLIQEKNEDGISKEKILKNNYITLKTKKIVGNLESKNNHFLIRGDNLFALKSLLTTHKKKVNIIYIDPPYNTGKDGFPYLDSYKRSSWLSFMKRRLIIAKELLIEDGVIFVSIDDSEQAYLKVLMDEIFGEENFISNFIWEKTYSPKNNNKYVSENHDYILCFSKNKSNIDSFNKLKRNDSTDSFYNKDDNDGRGKYGLDNLTIKGKKGYNIKWDGKQYIEPSPSGWRFSEEKMYELIKDNRIYLPADENKRPRLKRYLSDVGGIISKTILPYDIVGHTDNNQKAFNILFNNNQIFDYPKGTKLINYLIKLIQKNEKAIILDFFAGSGTTSHAVMELNKEDGGSRQFIGIQLPEDQSKDNKAFETDTTEWFEKTQISTLDEITIERIRRVIEGTNLKGEIIEKIEPCSDNKLTVLDLDFIHKANVSNNEIDIPLYKELLDENSELNILERIYNQDDVETSDEKASKIYEIKERINNIDEKKVEKILKIINGVKND